MSRARGFTLLEVLVVLVITGMIAAVLMQGLSLLLKVRVNLAQKIVDLDKIVLQRNLFIAPLQGLVPDYKEKPDVFTGTDRRLHGLTVNPLQSRSGVPVGFDLYFAYDGDAEQTSLMYRETGRAPVALGHWQGNSGSFSYRDGTGDWLSAWPPKWTLTGTGDDPMAQLPPQTPYLVRIEMGVGFPAVLIADVIGPHIRITRMKDTPMGSDIRP